MLPYNFLAWYINVYFLNLLFSLCCNILSSWQLFSYFISLLRCPTIFALWQIFRWSQYFSAISNVLEAYIRISSHILGFWRIQRGEYVQYLSNAASCWLNAMVCGTRVLLSISIFILYGVWKFITYNMYNNIMRTSHALEKPLHQWPPFLIILERMVEFAKALLSSYLVLELRPCYDVGSWVDDVVRWWPLPPVTDWCTSPLHVKNLHISILVPVTHLSSSFAVIIFQLKVDWLLATEWMLNVKPVGMGLYESKLWRLRIERTFIHFSIFADKLYS